MYGLDVHVHLSGSRYNAKPISHMAAVINYTVGKNNIMHGLYFVLFSALCFQRRGVEFWQ